MAANVDSTPINGAYYVAPFIRARHVTDVCWAHVHVLPKQAVDYYVEDESNIEGIDKKEMMPKNGSSSVAGYSATTKDAVRSSIRKAVEEFEGRRLSRPVDEKWKT